MKLHDTGVYLVNGVPQTSAPAGVTEADAKKRHHRLRHFEGP